MVRKLLLVALTSISYASALTLGSSDNEFIVNASSSTQNDFIASDSLTYRLGDYGVIERGYYSDGYGYIEVSIPYSVFDELSNYDIVYISIPNFSYNLNSRLRMRIDLYNEQGYFDYAIAGFEYIQLNEIMLDKLGFTVIENPPQYYNLFDPYFWDYSVNLYEIRLSFLVPSDIVGVPYWMDDITLFTKLASYSDFYSDGYADGIEEGITHADGTWLGNLIFGTVGSVVGFLFALSDFEVLGVSIMSIMALFVAIGIIMLFIKLIKGNN